MHSNLDKDDFTPSGAPRSPLPKLTRADREQIKRMLEPKPEEHDPVAALRLALAAKLPIRPEWRTEAVMDAALGTGDIAKRIADLAESRLVLKAPAVLKVLDGRSQKSPVPVFRAICIIALPRKGKKSPKHPGVWDEETTIRIVQVLIKVLPALFKGKRSQMVKAVQNALIVARETIVKYPTAGTVGMAIELLAKLELEAGWQALESSSARETIEMILDLPSQVAARLLQDGELDKLDGLVKASKVVKEADQKLWAFISGLTGATQESLPLDSRRWIAAHLGPSEIGAESIESLKSSDASLERLALILITAWDARRDGEKAMYSFRLLREILASAFGLFLLGEVGQPVKFDSALHELRGPLMSVEQGKLVRPRIEYRKGSDLQIMIKGMVEPMGN